MKVADFGAGSGFFTRAAARAVGPGGVVWAVDTHREILSRIKNYALAEGLENVEVVHGDAAAPKGSHLPEHSFDVVIAANLLFILGAQDTLHLIQEIDRVLRPGGRALLIDWTESHGGLGPHKDHVVDETAARAIIDKAGYKVVQEVPAGAYHWGLVIRKKSK